MKNINSYNQDSLKPNHDFIFDAELRPLRHVSLHEVQCKLNTAGAVGMLLVTHMGYDSYIFRFGY